MGSISSNEDMACNVNLYSIGRNRRSNAVYRIEGEKKVSLNSPGNSMTTRERRRETLKLTPIRVNSLSSLFCSFKRSKNNSHLEDLSEINQKMHSHSTTSLKQSKLPYKLVLKSFDTDNNTKEYFLETAPTFPESPQSSTMSSHPKVFFSDEQKTNSQFDQVYHEFIDTERTFVKTLEECINMFKKPMEELECVSPSQISMIFRNILDLFELHSKLLDEFNQSCSEKGIKVFLKYIQCFEIYLVYISNYEIAIQTIRQLNLNPKISHFLKKTTNSAICKGQNLHSYLIAPAQRIPRYLLLLSRMQKFASSLEMYSEIESAISQMTEMMEIIETSTPSLEYLSKLALLKSRLDEFPLSKSICTKGNKFITEFRLQEVIRSNAFKTTDFKSRIVYIFTDMVLWTDTKDCIRGQYLFENALAIQDIPSHPFGCQLISNEKIVLFNFTSNQHKRSFIKTVLKSRAAFY